MLTPDEETKLQKQLETLFAPMTDLQLAKLGRMVTGVVERGILPSLNKAVDACNRLADENEKLRADNDKLISGVMILQQENTELRRQAMRKVEGT